jgi:hypothetical protein
MNLFETEKLRSYVGVHECEAREQKPRVSLEFFLDESMQRKNVPGFNGLSHDHVNLCAADVLESKGNCWQ